jgi:putative flippase GtrA
MRRWHLSYQLVAFGAIGVMNTLIDCTFFGFFVGFLQWKIVPANIVSFCVGATNSYVMNGLITFKSKRGTLGDVQQIGRFACVTVLVLALSTVSVSLLAKIINLLPAKLISVAVAVMFSYLLQRYFVFYDRRNLEMRDA